MIRLLVIGHSVVDFIRTGETQRRSPGGIYYTVAALNRTAERDDDIYLCSQFDDDSYSLFENEFGRVKKDYLQRTGRIPRVHLNLKKGEERHEYYENISSPLQLNFRDPDEFDGILINMITGFDLTLEQLMEIRKIFRGIIYIDVHTLSRGVGKDFRREFRMIPDFKAWAANLDIIQVNEHELFTLTDKKTEEEIVRELFDYGIKLLCVTRGNKGAAVYLREGDKIISINERAKVIDNPSAVGCGDVFGAVFFYNYISNNDVKTSLGKAVAAAGLLLENKFL